MFEEFDVAAAEGSFDGWAELCLESCAGFVAAVAAAAGDEEKAVRVFHAATFEAETVS